MTLRLWQIVVLAVALPLTLTMAMLFGRYVIPHDPVNKTGSEFEQHMNDAFKARQGNYDAQRRIEERYGTLTTTRSVESALSAEAGVMEAYAGHHGGSYFGAEHDSGLEDVVVWATARSYCLELTAGGAAYHKVGPVDDIMAGPCPPVQFAR
jgi:hypothetical protein